jgi:hypothetical protein
MTPELARTLLDLFDDYGTMDAAARKGLLQEVMAIEKLARQVLRDSGKHQD